MVLKLNNAQVFVDCRSHRFLSGRSDQVGLLEEEREGASDHGSRVVQRLFVETAVIPELQPVEVVGSNLNIVLHACVLEVQLVVAE